MKRPSLTRVFVCAGIVLAFIGGCFQTDKEETPTPQVNKDQKAPVPKTEIEEACFPVEEKAELPPVPDGDLKKLVEGNNEFAFDLYQRLAKSEGNLVFSPYSISNALAMTYAGARGETAK